MFTTFLFDLDGTLSDSARGIINAAVYALNKLNRPVPEYSVLRKFLGPPLWESFEKFTAMDHDDACKAVDIYREYYREKGLFENELYDGIPQLLQTLKARGCTLGVATSKPEIFSQRILAHFGIDGYFNTITGALLDGSRKEKGEIIALALQRLKITDKSSVLMVGDRSHDILGAKSQGIACAAVLYGYGSAQEFEECGADYIVESPMDIAQLGGE